MEYKAEIKQEFLGEINGVEFHDKPMFYSVIFALDILDDYEINFSEAVIEALYQSIESVWMKSDITLADIEHDMYDSISATNRFPTDFGYHFDEVNSLLDKLQD